MFNDERRFKWKVKKEQLKMKAIAMANAAKEWTIRNKGDIIVLTPVIVGGITTVIKVVSKRANLCKEEHIKKLYCYDRSLGHYWELRRELSNKEWLVIDQRKKNGERLADILSELRVLK